MNHKKILWLVSIWTCYASKDFENNLNGESKKDLYNHYVDNAYQSTPTYNLRLDYKDTKLKADMDPYNIFGDDDLSEMDLTEPLREMTGSTAVTEENESPMHYNSYLLKYDSSPLKFSQEKEENEIEKENIQENDVKIIENILDILRNKNLSPIVGRYLDEDDFTNMMKIICASPKNGKKLWNVLLHLTYTVCPFKRGTLALAKFCHFATPKQKALCRFTNKSWKEASNEFKMLSQIFFSWKNQMNEILSQFIVRTGFCFDNSDEEFAFYHRALMLKSAEPCLITVMKSRKFIRITNKRDLCTKVDEKCETTDSFHKWSSTGSVDDILYHRKSSWELLENGEQIGDCVFPGITLSFFYEGKYYVLSDSMFYENQEPEGLSVQLTYRPTRKNSNTEFFVFKYEPTKRIQVGQYQSTSDYPFFCENIAEIQRVGPSKYETLTILEFSQNASRFHKINPENFNKIRNELPLPKK